MSIHPSFRGAARGAQQRSVLKRIERIKDLIAKGLWADEHSVLGLPKTKIVKIKIKKEKKVEKPEETTAIAPAAESETTEKESPQDKQK